MEQFRQYLHCISPIAETTWQTIAACFHAKTLKKYEYFAKEGRKEYQIAYVVSGTLRAFYRNTDGLEYNKSFFTADDLTGAYSSLTVGQTNQINIQALEDCDLLVADYPTLTALFDQYPDWERFARRYAELAFAIKEQREIALVLLDADKRYLLFREAYPDLEQKIAQYHIASYLGITPTQLSRIRAKKRRS